MKGALAPPMLSRCKVFGWALTQAGLVGETLLLFYITVSLFLCVLFVYLFLLYAQ